MSVTVITAPEALLDAAGAKALVPALASESDARLSLLLETVQTEIEPPHTLIGRAFGIQTLELRAAGHFWNLPCARRATLPLPFPPLRRVLSVSYADRDGVTQALPETAYQVAVVNGIPHLAPVDAWPETSGGLDAIRVSYEAGYDVGAPELRRAKFALVLMVQDLRAIADEDLFFKRETTEGIGTVERAITPQARQVLSATVDRLLAPLRVFL